MIITKQSVEEQTETTIFQEHEGFMSPIITMADGTEYRIYEERGRLVLHCISASLLISPQASNGIYIEARAI